MPNSQAAPSGKIEETASLQVTESRSETPRYCTVEGTLQTGYTNQLIHFNSVQDPTEVNQDAETLDLPSVK